MFTYCFVDKYGLLTPAEVGYNKDIEYLQSKVDGVNYLEFRILSRVF